MLTALIAALVADGTSWAQPPAEAPVPPDAAGTEAGAPPDAGAGLAPPPAPTQQEINQLGPAPPAPDKVDVQPTAPDEQIAARLQRILAATPWFEGERVEVDEGVVFLHGRTHTRANKEWAAQLASKTQDVVAVVNLLEVMDKAVWDFSPAWEQLRSMTRTIIQSLPGMAMAILVFAVTWLLMQLAIRMARRAADRRVDNPLLREVVAKTVAVPVALLGLYFAMQVSGLTKLAATVLGGTGIIGLVIGIAFRDIAENFLASILISIQRPFHPGDLILVADQQGYVQKVTSRGTVLMTLEGNYVQVPNATIYKSIIRNFTANPNTRLDFTVGLSYQDDAATAQEAIRRVLLEHDAVLDDPEPLVLVEELALVPPVVRLHAYFWINGREHSSLKVRSALVRLSIRALQAAGLTMPDAPRTAPESAKVREPLQLEDRQGPRSDRAEPRRAVGGGSGNSRATSSEGELRSEKVDIKSQAAQSREIEAGADLLRTR
ncbi:MAG TPA: mechanosensitive ion channel domain-containing protein [Lacipirellulaceae bacterium]|nr:mechanosensitive ion channel domain-containing protein [Lacipirellulaceae bacterium]